MIHVLNGVRPYRQSSPNELQTRKQKSRRNPCQENIRRDRSQDLPDREAGRRQIVLVAVHLEVLPHTAHVRIAEVGLVEPFGEVGQTAIGEDEEVNLEEEFLFA